MPGVFDHDDVDGSIRHRQAQNHAVARFDDVMDGTLDLNPLGVVGTGLEAGKADTRRVCGERSAAQDADLCIADDGTKPSRSADTLDVHQGSDEEFRGRCGSLSHIDASGGIVNEDRGISGAEVRIEVGDHSAQMDGIGADGLVVGEAMRLSCSGERGELTL